ncbi:MAG: recombinase family protein [Peptostreptococcaceae bacterium]
MKKNGQIIGYIRVSTANQNDDRQELIMTKYKVEKVFKEKVSGKNMKDREQLRIMLDYIREDDTIIVSDFSRLARSTKDLLNIVELIESKNATLKSDKENIDTSTPNGKLMLTMIGALNEFERQNILERQKEGIAIAKEKGVYKNKRVDEIRSKFHIYYSKYMTRQITKIGLSKELNISRTTLDKLIIEYKSKTNS